MHARLVAIFALVAASTAGAQDAKVWYVPTTAHYKITTVQKSSQEMNGQKQEFEVTGEQKVSVVLASSKKDSLDLTIVLDSMKMSASIPGAPDPTKLVGMKLNGVMSPFGVMYASKVTGADGAEIKNQQTEGMRRFLPHLPPVLKMGATWTDSTSGTMPAANGAELNRSAVVTYLVTGDTTVAGEKAWRIAVASKAKITGKGQQMGTDFTIDGGSIGAGTTYVSSKGVYLGMNAVDNQDLIVTVEAAGLIIPVKTTTNTKVEKITN